MISTPAGSTILRGVGTLEEEGFPEAMEPSSKGSEKELKEKERKLNPRCLPRQKDEGEGQEDGEALRREPPKAPKKPRIL